MSTSTAGWHSDPFGQTSWRWWNGHDWTGHTSDLVDKPPALAEPGWHSDPFGQTSWRWWNGHDWTGHTSGPVDTPPVLDEPDPLLERSAFLADSVDDTEQPSSLIAPAGEQLDPNQPAPTLGAESTAPELERIKPAPRLIRSPQDAEEVAAEWMRYWGYDDAHATSGGADGGIDVESHRAVAQVKDYGTAIGRPIVQQIQGAALGREALFFARSGYTREAETWAEEAGIALFRFDLQGEPEAVNKIASAVVSGTPNFAAPPLPPSERTQSLDGPAPPGRVLLQHAIEPIAALKRLNSERSREQLDAGFVLWSIVHTLHLALTLPTGPRQLPRQQRHTIHLDDLVGLPTQFQVQGALPIPLGPPVPVMESERRTSDVADEVSSLWAKAVGRGPNTQARRRLTKVTVPLDTIALVVVGQQTLCYPCYVGVMTSKHGQRAVVLDGRSGAARAHLGTVLTAMPNLLSFLSSTSAERIDR